MLILPQNNCREEVITLSARLSAIAESLPHGGVICDVGSDHGSLPLYMIQQGLISHALVTDLNAPPLDRAKKAFRDAGVYHKASFFLTDGIETLLSYRPDAFVIAGMGGETIAGILLRALSKMEKGTKFAFQPMTKFGELRHFLYQNGFNIEDEKAVSENGKSFLLIFSSFDGIPRDLDDKKTFLGTFLPQKKDADTADFFRKLLNSEMKKKSGKLGAGLSVENEMRRIDWICSILEEMNEDS